MVFSERLRLLRLELGMTQIDFSRQLDVSQSNYSKYEKGIVEPPYSFVTKIKSLSDINFDWLLTGEGSMFLEEEDISNPLREMVSIERGTGISAGYGIEAFEDEPIMLPKALLHGYPAKMFFAMPVIGRSMLPEINPGELALIRKQVLWNNTHNKVCAIRINGEVLLKKVVQLNKNILLQPFNPNFDPIIVNQETMDNIILLGTLYLTIRLWEKDKKQN